MNRNEKWLQWAIELQSLAQAGLTYGKDIYDRERYERVREISAEILSHMSELPTETVKNLFCNETGYQTPKLDTRAAIFKDERILLVRENNGKWSLPGGWCDVNISVAENTIKEVKEESGLDVIAKSIIAVQDRAKHNLPIYAYGYVKYLYFVLLLVGSLWKILKLQDSIIFLKVIFLILLLKKITKNKLKCALKRIVQAIIGKPYLINKLFC